jgi:lysophospholipase L1-like esterase
VRHLLLAAALGAVVVAALGVAAAAPAAAATEFVAVGDSITAGTSWPASCNICPVTFDCSGGCSPDTSVTREKCGHTRRLDDWIDTWLGAGDHVINRGVGGEKTAAAVGRLPGVLDDKCGTPGNCNAVILMHGTNDMSASNISPESARDNLGLMIAEARSRNIDTLLMTIIRKGLAPNNTKWETYKDLTLALATAENLQSVNPWLPLCPTTSCYNANYWLANKPPCNDPNGNPDPGHLDPDGYDVLTDLIKDEFPAAAPLAPATTTPAGDLTDTQPDFVWDEAATARWYELEVDGATTWWEAAVHCTGGVCTVDPGVVLAQAAHSWRVRGRNLRGMGAWSADTSFTVWGVPGTPTPSSPAGLFIDAMPTTAPFGWEPYTWSQDAEATDYDLVVADGGGAVLTRSFDASICNGSDCLASPDEGLGAGDYSWTVQARNPGASGLESAALGFEIYDQVPGVPVPTAPTGDHFEPFAPLYQWLPDPYATEYDLEVRDSGDNLDASAAGLLASAVCTGGLCSHQGAALPDPDDYTLKVRGRNVVGDSAFSSPGADFTLLACADPSTQDLEALQPSPVTTTEAVTHCGPVTAGTPAAYTIEATGTLTLHTRDGFRADDGFTVKGELTVRSP